MDTPFFTRLLTQIEKKYRTHEQGALIVGIYGPQGSGKTTLSVKLCEALIRKGVAARAVSLDDFYLSRLKRQQLSETVHPLLATRGVPGTHDVQLGIDVFKSVLAVEPTFFPVFDKAADDVAPRDQWTPVSSPVQILIFEGWCVGVPDILAQNLQDYHAPLNQLEKAQDSNGHWREYVAEKNTTYQEWYRAIDYMVGLQIPSFECIERWRWQQECELFEKTGARFFESQLSVRNFVAYFERITRVAQAHLNDFVDCVIEIDEHHSWKKIRFLSPVVP